MTRRGEENTGRSIPTDARSAAFDGLRGVVMIGVVLSHVLVGVVGAGLHNVSFGQLNSALYLLHMPLFALLAGMVLGGSAEKRNRFLYFLDRVGTFLWLYVLWTFIQGAVELATNEFRNNQTSLADVVTLWTPIAHLWFLTWIALATALALLIRPWILNLWRLASAGVVGVLSLWSWGVEGVMVTERGVALTFFFLLGAALTRERCERWIAGCSIAQLSWSFIISVLIYAVILGEGEFSTPTSNDPGRDLWSVSQGVLGTFSGSSALILLVVLAGRAGFEMRMLQRIGRESLAIFLMHLVFTAGTRVLLGRLGIDDVWIHVAIGTIAGVAAPMIVTKVVKGTSLLSWLLRAPWPSVPPTSPETFARVKRRQP